MKYAVIASQKVSRALPRAKQCSLVDVSRSSFYASLRREPSERSLADTLLLQSIRRIHAESGESYGVPRLRKALALEGARVGKARVGRLFRLTGLFAKHRRRVSRRGTFKKWIDAENTLGRDFTPGPADRRWAADITYLPTKAGVCYLAVVLDIGTRQVVGWATSAARDESLPLSALQMAITRRNPKPGLTHHADQGGQYWSYGYRRVMGELKMLPSRSGRAACGDNAVIESFFGTLKAECPSLRSKPENREAASAAAIDWIECWYNRRRLPSSLGYQTPLAYERMQN
ncbi:MAG: IS3 family transposase [Gemmatimonadales bacterium]